MIEGYTTAAKSAVTAGGYSTSPGYREVAGGVTPHVAVVENVDFEADIAASEGPSPGVSTKPLTYYG